MQKTTLKLIDFVIFSWTPPFTIKELKHRPDCTQKNSSRAWSTATTQPHPELHPLYRTVHWTVLKHTLKINPAVILALPFLFFFFVTVCSSCCWKAISDSVIQALGPFNNSTNNCILFLRLLACNGPAAALAPAVWEEREFVPRAKCIALGQLVPPNPRVNYPGSGNSLHPALSRNWSFQSLFKR